MKTQLFLTTILVILILTFAAQAQTSGFSYQGRFTDSSQPQPTNGTYSMQFALFDAAAGGTQVGSTITNPTVQVVNGVFTVNLDFGASSFDGAARFLEITVASTVLSPRQAISSAPYSIRSLNATTADNATSLGGTTANQFVQTNDSRLSDDRNPTAGSTNYIQNGTTKQTGNFNVSGNGTVGGTLTGGTVNALGQYNLSGQRVLGSNGNNNLFAGVGAGNTNSGADNSFFGFLAGATSTTGGQNALFGTQAGQRLTTGGFNTLIGRRSGENLTTGAGNVFIGNDTGFTNATGNSNTLLGSGANLSVNGLNFATAIGAGAVVGNSNSVVLGRGADTVRIPGNLDVTGTFTGSFTVPTSNLTGIVGIANGGTGLNAAGAAGNFLRSDGANWTSSPIQLADLPNLGNSFIQNGTTQQTGNFNISGNGTIGGDFTAAFISTPNLNVTNLNATNFNPNNINATSFVNAQSYRIGNQSILGNEGVGNLFAGIGAGEFNTGQSNSFFGFNAGRNSTTGNENAFFGNGSGFSNGAGSFNAFFGYNAGGGNQGSFNTFIGRQAGFSNTTGAGNVFLGNDTGLSNNSGSSNTLIGSGANVGGAALNFATAIGAGATATANNSITLGRSNGFDTVRMPGGMGGSLALNGNTLFLRANNDNSNSIVFSPNDNGVIFNAADRFLWSNPFNGGTKMSLLSNGNLIILGTYGQTSDARYKTDIQTYVGGLDAVMRLRGVTYFWKPELQRDSRLQIGFIAQEVEAVMPELVTTDENGYKSVSYANAVPVLVEAIKEQQTQIETLNETIKKQQEQIEQLKQIVCAANPNAGLCKEK